MSKGHDWGRANATSPRILLLSAQAPPSIPSDEWVFPKNPFWFGFLAGDESGAVAVYGGRASDFPAGSPLSQLQPLDAFVFAGPAHRPSTNLTETLIPGRQPYQLSSR